MGTVLRCCLVIIAVTLWLMFAISTVEGSRSRNRGGGSGFHFFLKESLGETPYTECDALSGRAVAKVTNVEVVGCNDDPCPLKAGTTATIKLGFVPSINVTSFHAVVHGVIGVVPLPFHVPHPDGCSGCGIKCPLVAGTEYHYTNTIPVLSTYPRIEVKVKWELVSQAGKDILCVIIPTRIVS